MQVLSIFFAAINSFALIYLAMIFRKQARVAAAALQQKTKCADVVKEARFHANGFVRAHLAILDGAGAGAVTISPDFAREVRRVRASGFQRKSGTLVCSMAIGEDYTQSVQACLDTQKRFAAACGWDYGLVSAATLRFARPVPWLKIVLLARALQEGYERVMFIDADAMVTAPNAGLAEACFETLAACGQTMMFTEDGSGINSGVIFLRNTPHALAMLDMVWAYDANIHDPTWEQNAINILANLYPGFARQIAIEPNQRRFNAFPAERRAKVPTDASQIWQRGDFICHFAGLRAPQLGEYVRKYAADMDA